MLTFTGKNYMDAAKQKRLEEKGWKIGSVLDFLVLTDEEHAEINEVVEEKLSTTTTSCPSPPAPAERPPTKWGE